VDTALLLHALLVQHEVTARVDADLLARVGGNPLFAEEYARLLRDRRGQPGSLPVPATVQAVIAARLDGLPPQEKAVLADAAVVGQVAWVGAIAAVGGCDPADLDAWLDLNRRLAELERRELLGRVPGSRVAGEVEVCFRHVLVHEVAYGQLPRAARADRHWRAAGWLEGLAPDRTAERAELLAHHYTAALTDAKAAGSATAELVDRARLALRAAGDHAVTLGAHATAARHYKQALALWPADDPDRPELELRAGEARCLADGSGKQLLLRARDGLLASGDRERAAEAEVLLGQLAYAHALGRERAAHVERALALVAGRPPSRSKATVLRGCSWHLMVADRHAEALPVARQALAMARTLKLGHLEADALGIIGAARINLGDPGGLADLERCVALCEELGSSLTVSWHLNLANSRSILGDLHGCAAALAAAKPTAERLGSARGLRWLQLERAPGCYWSGRWDEAMAIADAVAAEAADGARHLLEGECRIWRGRIRLARGELDGALQDSARVLQLARESGDRQDLDPALAFAARALLAGSHTTEAAQLVDELLASLRGLLKPDLGVDLAVDLLALGHDTTALDPVLPSPWLEAARAFMARGPQRAADIYATIGSRPDEAYARLEAARQLLAAGHALQANAELATALAFYREVRATTHLEEAKQLLFVILPSSK
jgi:tetratricopeptide (TPR) repeat protein